MPALARRGVIWPFWLIAVTTSALGWSWHFAFGNTGWQWTPWLVGIAVLGLPHGAQDERLFPRGWGKDLRGRISLLVLYVIGVALVLCVWRFNPKLGLVSFLILAGFHFGEGDLAWSRDFGVAGQLSSRWHEGILLVLRGALPIVVPIVAFPASFALVASSLPGISLTASSYSSWIGISYWVVVALIGIQATFLLQPRVKRVVTWQIAVEEIADTLVMFVLFLSLPPLLSVGIYFLFAHSHRYIARRIFTLGTEGCAPQDLRGYVQKLWRFHRRTLWISAATVAFLPFLWLALQKTHWSFSETGPALLIALNALTLPHALLVWYSDFRGRRAQARTAVPCPS